MNLYVHEFGFWLSKQTPNPRQVGTNIECVRRLLVLTIAEEEEIT
jgi:hypothetical protein